ncbi:MAG: TolC family protein [Mucilaginibacter polytrichastri]|nr:TolC family protein [Mucilaginibacter polytrichastri]
MKRLFSPLIFSLAIIGAGFLPVKKAHAQSAATTVYTLQQCIETAIKNNLDVQQSELDMQSARISWQQAKESLLPTVGADLSHNFNQGRSIDQFTNTYVDARNSAGNYGISSNLILFNGLSRQQAIRRDALAYKAGQMDYQQAKDNITLNVIQAYLTVLNAEDALSQADSQVAVSMRQVARLKIMNDRGAVAPSDYYDLQGQSGDDKVQRVEARNSVYAAVLILVQYMNVPFKNDLRFERSAEAEQPKPYTKNTTEIYQAALKQFAQIRAAEFRTASAKKAVQVLRGQYFPRLSAGAGLGTTYSSLATNPATDERLSFSNQFKNNYNTFFGFGLTIPLLNGFQTRNQVRQAKLDFQSASITESTVKIQLRQNIERASVDVETAEQRLNVLAEQVAAYKESFRIAEVRFNAGAINSVDFLVSKRNLDRVNLNMINARYNLLTAIRVLEYYHGRLSL